MVTSRSVPQQTAHIFSALAGQNRSALRFSQIGQNHDTSAPQRKTTVQQNTLAKDETQKASRARFWPNCPQGTFRGLRVPLRIRQTENTHFQAPERFIVVGAFFILVLGISALCDIRWLHFFFRRGSTPLRSCRFLLALVRTTGFFALDMAVFQPRYLGRFRGMRQPHLP